jgi:hypothetical protein
LVDKTIQEIIDKIFPKGMQVVDDVKDVAPQERFWVIPGKHGPRWLIPQDSNYGCHIFKQWKPYNLLSRIKWKFLYVAYRTGLLGIIPGVTGVCISGCTSQQWSYLGWEEHAYPVPGIYIGTFGPTQKIVVSLVNSKNKKLISVAKIPFGVHAENNIVHEYEVLRSLAVDKPGVAPTPLYLDRKLGCSNQEAIQGRLIGRQYSYKLNVFLNGLKTKNTTSVYAKSSLLSEKLLKLENISDKLRSVFFDVIKGLKDTTELSAYYVHGDFVPWNIIETKDGAIVAVDWEMADLNGLPLYDFFYFHYQQNYLFNWPTFEPVPYGALVQSLSEQVIEKIKRYTLIAIALEHLSANADVSYFVDELRKL